MTVFISKAGENSAPAPRHRHRALLLASAAVVSLSCASVAYGAGDAPIDANGENLGERTNVDITVGLKGRAVLARESGSVTILSGNLFATSSVSPNQSFGILAGTGGQVTSGADITTTGARGHAVQAGFNGTGANGTAGIYDGSSAGAVDLTGGTIITDGDYAVGLHAIDSGVITANGVTIKTLGPNSPGAHAESNSTIGIANSSITTAGSSHGVLANNDRVGATGGVLNLADTDIITANGNGVRVEKGGTANLTNGSIKTSGAWAYAVYATGSGSAVEISGTAITTTGNRGYGLLADTGAVINGSVGISTTGENAHAVQAGANGTKTTPYPSGSAGAINLTGGLISTTGVYALGLHAVDAGVITASGVGISTSGATSFGAQVESESRIDLANSSIATTGAGAHGVVANNDRAGAAGGVINLTNSAIVASGPNAHAAVAENGGQVNLLGGSLAAQGDGASGLVISNGGRATVDGTAISSVYGAAITIQDSNTLTLNNSNIFGGSSAIATSFTTANQNIGIVIGAGSTVDSAAGVLLAVDRTGAGGDTGAVSLTLADGSVSRGNIQDEGTKTTGYTDVELGAQATWSGVAIGVRNFVSLQTGGQLNFGSGSIIEGDLSVSDTQVTFGPGGATIGGDVGLTSGSTTTGGSIGSPIVVGGNMFVDQSSVQGGNWFIGGNLTNQGVITPGNSIGVVQVAGNLALAGSSVYRAEINGAGQSDLIMVGGTAGLAGRVEVSPYPANGGFLVGTPYTIVTATGGFGGSTFEGGVTWTGGPTSIFLAPALTYDTNNAYVTIGRNAVAMASVAATPNQAAAAAAVDRLPVTNALFTAIAFQTSAVGARQAFDAISGEAHASIAGALVEDSHIVRDAVNNRLRQAFGEPVAAANNAQTQSVAGLNATVWGQAFGSWGHSSSREAAKTDRSTAGFLVGVDAPAFDNWRFGIAAGYGRTSIDVDQRLSSASVDSYNIALYGGTTFGAIGVRFGAAYTWNDADVNRSVVFPGYADGTRASYRSGIAQVFGEASYAARFGATSLEPFLNVAWVNLDTDSFREVGGSAALWGKTGDMNTAFTTLGARLAHRFELANGTALTARGAIGWRHAFGDVDPTSWMSLAGGASSFTVTGAPIARNSLLLEAGLDMDVASNVSLGVAWTGQIADRVQDHSVKGNFKVRF